MLNTQQIGRDDLIDTGEVRLRVRVSGSGPPLMFTSTGWGPSVDLYLQTMPQLAERFTVAWIDPRGTGRSDRPSDGNYRFTSFVRDFICSPPLGQRIHMALPGSKFVLIENCGHFPWIEQPEQFWRSVDVALAACGVE